MLMATVGKTEDLKNDRIWGRERLRESRFSRLYRPEISLNVKNTMQQASISEIGVIILGV